MTSSEEGSRETLKYKLQGAPGDIAQWGHEYIRHLAGGCCAGWLFPSCWRCRLAGAMWHVWRVKDMASS
jgi:hypothetical protein